MKAPSALVRARHPYHGVDKAHPVMQLAAVQMPRGQGRGNNMQVASSLLDMMP